MSELTNGEDRRLERAENIIRIIEWLQKLSLEGTEELLTYLSEKYR